MVLRAVHEETGEVVDAGALQLQEWIEKGVFDALSKGYLAGVDLDVMDRHPADPTARVLESYSFKVSGGGPDAGSEAELTLRMSNLRTTPAAANKPTITRDDIHSSMQRMIKSLVMLTATLDQLPADRFVSMSLSYNASVPPEYEPPLFCAGPPVPPAFAGSADPLTMALGEVKTGHGGVSLVFRHAAPLGPAVPTTPQQQQHHPTGAKQPIPSSALTQPDPPTQKVESGYDSDSTDAHWARKKAEMLEGAIKIADAVGPDMAETAVRSSHVARGAPPELMDEILAGVRAYQADAKAKAKAAGKTSRVKRPMHQTSQAQGQAQANDDGASQDVLAGPTFAKRVATYSHKGRR